MVNHMHTLDNLEPGASGTVTSLMGMGGVRRRMLDMGIVPGATVTMVRRAPFGDPVEVTVCGYLLSLRKAEAGLVVVKEAP